MADSKQRASDIIKGSLKSKFASLVSNASNSDDESTGDEEKDRKIKAAGSFMHRLSKQGADANHPWIKEAYEHIKDVRAGKEDDKEDKYAHGGMVTCPMCSGGVAE